MLGDVIVNLLPSALAVALSPIPIVGVILVLGTPRARSSGPAFAAAWIAGLAAVSVVVLLVASPGADSDHDDPGLSWLKVGAGALLLLLAVREWMKRPKGGEEPELPGWVATIDSATPRRSAVIGVALAAANPKNLALTLAASASIAEAGLDAAGEAVAVAAFVAIGSITVAGAVLFYLVDAKRAARPLAALRQFMSRNSALIMAAVLLLIGAKLLVEGLGGV